METELYDEMYRYAERHWWFRGRRRIVFSLLDRRFPGPTLPAGGEGEGGGRRVLDLGCGVGTNLAALARYGEVWGADVSPHALAYSRRGFTGRLDEVEIPGRVPYPDASFDLIVMFDVLEHIQDDAVVAGRVHGLLKPGGLLALTVPALRWLWSQHDVEHQHFRRYHRPELRRLLETAGFRILKLSYLNTFLFPAMAGARLCLPARAYSAKNLKAGAGRAARILEAIYASERHLLRWVSLPIGGSLVALAQRPER